MFFSLLVICWLFVGYHFHFCIFRLELNMDLPSAQSASVGQSTAAASGEQVHYMYTNSIMSWYLL